MSKEETTENDFDPEHDRLESELSIEQTCGEIVADLAAQAPNCPKHPDVKMVYADGMEHHHDLKYPHWRCELWVGSGVCGATRPLKAAP